MDWVDVRRLFSRRAAEQGHYNFAIRSFKRHKPFTHAWLSYSKHRNYDLAPDLTSSPLVLGVELECSVWEICLLRTQWVQARTGRQPWTDEKGLVGRLWLEEVIWPNASKEDARARLRISSGILSQRDKRNTSHSHSEAWYRLKTLAPPKVRPRRKYGGNSRLVPFLTSHQNPTRPVTWKHWWG